MQINRNSGSKGVIQFYLHPFQTVRYLEYFMIYKSNERKFSKQRVNPIFLSTPFNPPLSNSSLSGILYVVPVY